MRRILFLGLLAVLAAGCVPSKNRLYTKDDLVFEEALLGDYEEIGPNNDKILFVQKGDDKGYVFGTKGTDERTPLHLLRLGDHYFMDTESWFLKIGVVGQEVHVWLMNPEWLKGLVDKDPKAVEHEIVQQKVEENGVEKIKEEVRLTAPTKDLQAFVLKHLDNPRAWNGPIRYQPKGKLPVRDEGLFSKKQQTFEAWWEYCRVMRSVAADPAQGVALERLAEGVETLGKLSGPGVDADAAAVLGSAAKSMDKIVEQVRKGQNADKEIKAFVQDSTATAKKTATMLSERYKMKFGSIE